MSELWVPADRLLRIIEKTDRPVGTFSANSARKISLLRSGQQKYVSLNAADKMLYELDLDVWLRLPEDQDGLADIYEDGKQYGSPRPEPKPRQERERQTRRDRLPRHAEVACPDCGERRTILRESLRAATGLCRLCAQRRRHSLEPLVDLPRLVSVPCVRCGVPREVGRGRAKAAASRPCWLCARRENARTAIVARWAKVAAERDALLPAA